MASKSTKSGKVTISLPAVNIPFQTLQSETNTDSPNIDRLQDRLAQLHSATYHYCSLVGVVN